MKKRLYKIIISAVLFVIALLVMFPNIWINRIIYILSYLIVGFEILKKAVRNIKRGKVFDENFLMSVATIGAFAIGEFPEAVAVMLFYQIGEIFQDYAVDKSRKSISSLMDIRPDHANVLRDGKEEKVDPDNVKIGEIIIVKPGEKVPIDGVIEEGTSFVDTKALTGEPTPKKVCKDEEVLSGCINLDGILKIKVTKKYDDSTVSKILELVENASSKKSKSEKFITKFAKYYTPIVVIIAVALAIIPPLLINGATFSEWIYRALSFLVVSCPCALVISIPLSFFGGIGGASKNGILIKGSNYLEALASLETIVFDKTGTLTEGVFDVQKIEPVGLTKEELLEIAALAEWYSNHPIAKSIKKAYNKNAEEIKIKDVKEISGKGIIAKIEEAKVNNHEKQILVGNEKLMEENNISFEKSKEIGTILYIAIDGVFSGTILISDKIKDDSVKAIYLIKKNGIKQTIMLTGDKKEIAEHISKKIGIDKVHSELLPDGKTEKMEQLLKEKGENKKIAYVGDGINDAPVLALADIGIAMGALGSDSAIEASDIVIMTDEPSKINTAIKISKKTMKIVRENIVFAIFVKILILVLSALGIATLWAAVFADVGVSVIAIFNSLRMLSKKI
ncbi:MAG: cadmium-translocating P-type ATPase [Clostridia bacterium]|nr:cadmium-translocating P-type ATPase [Clostridia bacterium]